MWKPVLATPLVDGKKLGTTSLGTMAEVGSDTASLDSHLSAFGGRRHWRQPVNNIINYLLNSPACVKPISILFDVFRAACRRNHLRRSNFLKFLLSAQNYSDSSISCTAGRLVEATTDALIEPKGVTALSSSSSRSGKITRTNSARSTKPLSSSSKSWNSSMMPQWPTCKRKDSCHGASNN